MVMRLLTIVSVLHSVIGVTAAWAEECPIGWEHGPFKADFAATDGPIYATIVYDPPGPTPAQLIVAGEFAHAGSIEANNIAAWDGFVWRALGDGTDGPVKALTVFNGNLVIGGNFTHAGPLTTNSRDVAAWTGSQWLQIGNGIGHPDPQFYSAEEVRHLAVFNGRLIAAGTFLTAGGQAATRKAQLIGSTWSGLGEATIFFEDVTAVGVYDPPGAAAAALYMALDRPDFDEWASLMKWDGTTWTECSTSDLIIAVNDMTVTSQGLVLAGMFYSDFNTRAVRAWNGTAIVPIGPSVGTTNSERGDVVATYNGQLHAIGVFQYSVGPLTIYRLAAWGGSLWSLLGGTFLLEPKPNTTGDADVYDAVQFGSDLIVAGEFERQEPLTDKMVRNLARWDGAQWWRLKMPVTVSAMATLGSRLVIGGHFGQPLSEGGVNPTAYYLATWDGRNVRRLQGDPNGPVRAMKSFAGVATNSLIVGGDFTQVGTQSGSDPGGAAGSVGAAANRIAVWEDPTTFGGGWSALGNGFNNSVYAIERLDGHIYAGGAFTASGTGSPAFSRIAKWTGSSWSSLGSGVNGTVRTIKGVPGAQIGTSFVFVGGDFTTASGLTVNHVASWWNTGDHATEGWRTMGPGLNGNVHAIEIHDGTIFAAGEFTASGSTPINHVALFSGSAWVPVGAGLSGPVYALKSHNGYLYAAGDFLIPGTSHTNVARWDGVSWSAIEESTNGPTYSIQPFRTELVFGGDFAASDIPQNVGFAGLRRWMIDGLPWILGQPESQVVLCRAKATFETVLPDGYEAHVFLQWFKDGEPLENGHTGTGSYISGAVGSSKLTIASANATDAGEYSLRAFNGCGGELNTNVVTLTVVGNCPPCPADFVSNSFSPPPDGVVDGADLAFLLGDWGDSSPADMVTSNTFAPPPDGFVDAADLAILLAAWGPCH